MTAVRALLDAKTPSSNRRAAPRRTLRLEAPGSGVSGATDVLIMDLSTTGILLSTAGDLAKGEMIELDIPEAVGVSAIVKWRSAQFAGCQFSQPIPSAAVSRLLLRAPYEPANSLDEFPNGHRSDLADHADDPGHGKHSLAARMSWIVGLALLSWAVLAAAVSVAWGLFR